MNFELDAPYLEIQSQARRFARAIEPVAAQADEMSEIHPGVLAALRDSGLSNLMVQFRFMMSDFIVRCFHYVTFVYAKLRIPKGNTS